MKNRKREKERMCVRERELNGDIQYFNYKEMGAQP